jgi:hypothetical protein
MPAGTSSRAMSVDLAISTRSARFPRGRLADKAQDGPTNRFDQFLCSTDGVCRTIVCEEMQPPSAVIDKRQVLDKRHRERTWGSSSRPKDAVREEEAVALSPGNLAISPNRRPWLTFHYCAFVSLFRADCIFCATEAKPSASCSGSVVEAASSVRVTRSSGER